MVSRDLDDRKYISPELKIDLLIEVIENWAVCFHTSVFVCMCVYFIFSIERLLCTYAVLFMANINCLLDLTITKRWKWWDSNTVLCYWLAQTQWYSIYKQNCSCYAFMSYSKHVIANMKFLMKDLVKFMAFVHMYRTCVLYYNWGHFSAC